MKTQKFLLNLNINLYLNLIINKLIIKFKNVRKFLFLPSFFFFSSYIGFSLFFDTKLCFRSFISHFRSICLGFYSIFTFNYKLRGLGYRIKSITKKFIRIFMGTTNFYYLHIPMVIFSKVKRRRIFLFSSSKSDLKMFSIHLESLKKLIPYKLRGFFFPKQILLMKPGKKRF